MKSLEKLCLETFPKRFTFLVSTWTKAEKSLYNPNLTYKNFGLLSGLDLAFYNFSITEHQTNRTTLELFRCLRKINHVKIDANRVCRLAHFSRFSGRHMVPMFNHLLVFVFQDRHKIAKMHKIINCNRK